MTRHVTRPTPVSPAQEPCLGTFRRGQLRNPGAPDTGELAAYRCYSPAGGTAARAGPGGRTALDGGGIVPASKGLASLDEHQFRRWTSWRRWTPLAMLAHGLS